MLDVLEEEPQNLLEDVVREDMKVRARARTHLRCLSGLFGRCVAVRTSRGHLGRCCRT